MVVSGGCADEEHVLCTDPALDVAILRSNHEEADTRFVFHPVNLNGIVDNIVVSARDTDVIILLLAHLSKIRSKVWIWAGTSKTKYIPLGAIHLVRTHRRGGGGMIAAYISVQGGRGVTTPSVRTQNKFL